MSTAPIVKFASKSFTLPNTCVRLRGILDDPSSDIEDMAKVMSLDPSLSAKVLKLANSALFRFPAQVSSVPKALSIIGGEAAYNISMAETANLAFKSFESAQINFDRFWHKAVLNGLIAKALAQQKQIRGSERYFVLGILQNLSELVCATRLPEKYAIYKEIQHEKLPLQAQKDVFGFTFPECSGLILESWHLPDTLSGPLKELTLEHVPSQGFDASLLYIAQAMSHLEQGRDIRKHPAVDIRPLDEIGLKEDDYDIILEFALAESLKIAATLK
ncbi:HDOD domain-containing protein [Glaciecola siphonariae]|uniref:HDOD domain-containing protein n=1 Tax=Glaciecola siphonariae TaxID=521012 RepID=A0ABV9LUR6_9ALTE